MKYKVVVLVYDKNGLFSNTGNFICKNKTSLFKMINKLINNGYTSFNIRGIKE